MKKSFSVTGQNGTFHGEVEVILNAETRTRMMRNQSMHEDQITNYYVHRVIGRVEGQDMFVMDTEAEDKVPAVVDATENRVTSHLHWVSTREVTQTLDKILRDRGYN